MHNKIVEKNAQLPVHDWLIANLCNEKTGVDFGIVYWPLWNKEKRSLGNCSITATGLKGAVEGLKLAWRKGYRKVNLKMDSTTTIDIIKNCDKER
ncbi:unnamed protein product [Linum tenue]|uniref:RNase H type-1 domain-containing protein n=1 Tax=Linum tenue TaxID=586396 RepID=A0AAV0JQN6_9ROSI|nr:unnamed protein product [Linum tenue]